LNSISEVYKLQNGYVVAQVAEVIAEGLEKFEDIQPKIKQLCTMEKQYQRSHDLAVESMKKAGNDLSKLPQIDSRILIANTGRFNSTTSIPMVGKDNAFIYTALNMNVGETSDPVKGVRGYYVIHLNDKTPFDSTAFEAQLATIRNTLYQEKKNTALSEWIAEIKEKADIKDNRYKFFGY